MVFSPTLEELAQVEGVLLARLREGATPGPIPLEDRLVWGTIRQLLDDTWHGEDPLPMLARIDPFDPRQQRARLIPAGVGDVLISLFAVITAPLDERRRRRLFRAWLGRNLDAVTATAPAYPADADQATALDRALVQEVARARHDGREPRLSRFLRFAPRSPSILSGLPTRRLAILETVGLLELPLALADALAVDPVLPEVRLRVLER